MELRLVGPEDVAKLLKTFAETSGLAIFTSVDEARAA
jgi:hypothetical protein